MVSFPPGILSKNRGFTLIELILAIGMLGLLIIAIFRAFEYGALAFRTATARQDAQSVTKQAYVNLRDDLRRSHFRSTSVQERVKSIDGVEVRRDALCIAGLQDWSLEESFDELNGLPKWDRYILYYGTLEGQLIRSLIDPDRPDFSPGPFRDLDPTTYLKDDPSLNTGYQKSYRIMSRELREFKCQLNPAKDTVTVSCLLELENRNQKSQTEVKLTVFPQNTWPKGESS